MFSCDKTNECPYVISNKNCDLLRLKINDELISILKHLWADVQSLEQNERSLWDIEKSWDKEDFMDVLSILKSIIINQKKASLQTLDTVSKAMESLQEENEQLKKDRLTGLLNRHSLEDNYQKLVDSKKTFSVGLIDIDDFKKVNDKYGHPAWDKVLKLFAWWLIWIFSQENVYRVGWEEFLVLFDVDNNQLKAKLEDLLYSLKKKTIQITGHDWFKVTFSAWVVKYSGEENFHELYEKVDALLYRSKKAWKNRVNI